MPSSYRSWDCVYHEYLLGELPWELGKPRPILVQVVEEGFVKPGKALDICCGAGTNTVYLAEKGFQATGLDISHRAVECGREKAEETGVRVRWIIGNALDFPFEDGEFDFVFDMGCFHHIHVEDRERFITGLCRITKPDGQYLLTCFSDRNGPVWNYFTKEQLIELFSSRFTFQRVAHYGSVEGDGFTRFLICVNAEEKKTLLKASFIDFLYFFRNHVS
jgi:ubiquinone/menaquinone biosynthesis C-methylase UbiE